MDAPIDPIEATLLSILQEDCSGSLAELGDRVGLSVSAVRERLGKLKRRGHVRAYVALIDPQAVGYATCAFVRVLVEGKGNEERLIRNLAKQPEVQECHRISGEYPCQAKVWVRDLHHLEDFVEQHCRAAAGFLRVQTAIVTSSGKDAVTGLSPRAETSVG